MTEVVNPGIASPIDPEAAETLFTIAELLALARGLDPSRCSKP